MKTLTVRLPEALVAQIEAESRRRKLSKSDVVRERLTGGEGSRRRRPALLDAIADVVGSVDGLPRDLSARTKKVPEVDGIWRKAHSLMPVFWWRSSVAAMPTMGGPPRRRRACRRPGRLAKRCCRRLRICSGGSEPQASHHCFAEALSSATIVSPTTWMPS